MRVGYLGPEGTYSHQALLDSGVEAEATALATLYDTVMAVQDGVVDAALVPIENSLEGSVDVTLDTLATDATDVAIVGETVAEIRNCLIAARPLELAAIETVYSHPQANAQCAQFLRTNLRGAKVIPTSSTADAVRSVNRRAERSPRRARQPPCCRALRRRDPARGRRRPRRQSDALRLARAQLRRRSHPSGDRRRRRRQDLDRLLGRRRRLGRLARRLSRRARRPRHQPHPHRVEAAADRPGPLHVLRGLRGRRRGGAGRSRDRRAGRALRAGARARLLSRRLTTRPAIWQPRRRGGPR